MRRMVDDKEMIQIDDRITALEQGGVVADAYTKAESDAIFQTKIGMALYATQQQLNLNIAATEARTDLLLANKQDKLTAGAGIDITNNTISVDATAVPFKTDLATVAFSGNYDDLTNKPTIPAKASTYTLALGTASDKFWFATITAESGLEGNYGPENDYAWYTFITKYARYVNWYYENANDTSGNNHKSFIIKNPGQTLLFYGMDGSDFVPTIPPTVAYLTVTKTN